MTMKVFVGCVLLVLGSSQGIDNTEFAKNDKVPHFEIQSISRILTKGRCPIKAELSEDSVRQFEDDLFGFGWKLYKQISKTNTNGNLAFSPASLYIALQMVYEGAAGDTAEEIRRALFNSQLAKQDIRKFYVALLKYLGRDNARQRANGVELYTTNRLFYDTISLTNGFTRILSTCFSNHPIKTRMTRPREVIKLINNIVSKDTNGMITEILQPDSVDRSTTVLLLNAFYFKAGWEFADLKLEVNSDKFTTGDQSKVDVNMLTMVGYLPHYEDSSLGVKVVGLHYKGKGQTMFLILPNRKGIDSLNALERSLTASELNRLLAKTSPKECTLRLPKFSIGGQFNFKDALVDLGVSSIFTDQADFSNMLKPPRRGHAGGKIRIGNINHKAVIELNENGTEIAAATSLDFVSLHAREHFTANRPFLFLVRDNPTNTVLFMGRVTNPQERLDDSQM